MKGQPLKILLVEDENSYAVLVEGFLRDAVLGQYDLVHVQRMSEAEERLRAGHFDVVLLDLSLPDSQGFATYTRLKALAPSVPVILLTGNDDERLAFQAVREGAQDYLVKGQVDGRMLMRVIRYAIERKKAEEALCESEEFFRLISENMTDLIAVIDRSGQRLFRSPSYQPLMGDSLQTEGTNPFEEIHPDDRGRIMRIFQESIQSGIGRRAEYRMMTPSGGIRHLESQWSVIHDAAGKPAKVVVVSRDITGRKEAVEVLRQALSDLKKSHEELQATQLQLIQSERLEAISTFASGVAHEVKNPLQTIILGIDYLSHHISSDDTNAAIVLEDMTGAVKRADAIIRGLLEFSAQNKREVKDEDLNGILEQSLRTVQHELSHHPIRLVKELAPDLPPVRLDAKTMKHVFVNLLLYSFRAMTQGGALAVRTGAKTLVDSAEDLKSGHRVVIAEVEEFCASDPKNTTVNSDDQDTPGSKPSGLGINVLRKIIELSGGTINVTNRKEAGNKYTVTFKAQREPG